MASSRLAPTALPLTHVGAPGWNTVLQGGGSHESRVDGENHLPQPAGHTSDVAQGPAGFMGCEHILILSFLLL